MALEIDYKTYYDKVLGGWYGKFIAGTIGGPVEGVKDTLALTYYQELPDVSAPNDDADFQVVWLHALEEHGAWLSGQDLAHEWLDHIWYPFCEYGYGMKNFARAIYPPTSGWFNNEYFKECMGCPIRSEIWAFVAPGAPALAREYAWYDATLDHADASVEAEQFFATIEALAFFENDMDTLLAAGMSFLPEESRLRRCLEDTYEWHERDGDWKSVRMKILSKYASPDFTNAVQNIGFTLLALLEGKDDFEKVMLTAANCGYDTDCTCATAGAIIGIIHGAQAIPAKWKDPLQDRFSLGIDYERPYDKISVLTEDTCAMGVYIARARETGVEILDAPRQAKPQTTSTLPALRLTIDYPEGPGISPGQEVCVQPAFVNATQRDIAATIRVRAPEPLQVAAAESPVRAAGMDVGLASCGISCPDNITALPLANVCEAQLIVDGQTVHTQQFGLSGSWMWRVFGPFWDGKSGFANKVEFGKEYLPEADITPDLPVWGESIPYHRQFIFSTAEDRFSTADLFGCAGPMVVYLLQYIECPEDRDHWFIVGNSSSFRLWLNGGLEMEDDTPHPYMPFDNCKIVRLNKGINKVLVKLVRHGDEMQFSFGVRNVERTSWHSSTWTTDIAIVPPVDDRGLK